MDNNKLVSVHIDGRITTTSLIVAEHFNKAHSVVMRSIRNLDCSEEFGRCNFALSSYKNEQNKELPCYCITRDGFMFLVMGFTGKEAAMWKERFINAFNAMEKKLRDQELTEGMIKHLRGKDMKMQIGYDGKLYFRLEEPTDPYASLASAIKDPSNIGLKDETILMMLNACVSALAHRAASRKEWGTALSKRLKELDPGAFKLPLKAS